jgi:hypothetical protein
LAGRFGSEETVARLVKRQFARDQISFSRKDVSIFPDADDLAGAFQLAQGMAKGHPLVAFERKLARDLSSIQWPIIPGTQEPENLFTNGASILPHASEKLMSI